MTWHDMTWHDMTWHDRRLRTWVHDNHCYLWIKSDTGQHSQFLRCLFYIWFQEHQHGMRQFYSYFNCFIFGLESTYMACGNVWARVRQGEFWVNVVTARKAGVAIVHAHKIVQFCANDNNAQLCQIVQTGWGFCTHTFTAEIRPYENPRALQGRTVFNRYLGNG